MTPSLTVGLLLRKSQIRQPPIAPARLQTREPLAQRIQQQHPADPTQVNDEEIETVTERRIRKPLNRRLEQPAHGFTENEMEHDGDRMSREPLQEIVEQRHPSEGYEKVSKPGAG